MLPSILTDDVVPEETAVVGDLGRPSHGISRAARRHGTGTTSWPRTPTFLRRWKRGAFMPELIPVVEENLTMAGKADMTAAAFVRQYGHRKGSQRQGASRTAPPALPGASGGGWPGSDAPGVCGGACALV